MTDSGSDDLNNESQIVLYRDRAEWNDVSPVEQDDGPNPIVSIFYSELFKDVYDYFRAILKTEEKSERALELTEDALELNPANYTAWKYRREILKALNKDLISELEYVRGVIKQNPKNYQVWHHRRIIVEWLQDPSHELELTEFVLGRDAKNYHAWQHRQWVIHTFKLYDNELEYVDRLLNEDIRNNSAWNQRYFVLNHTTDFPQDLIDREVAYSLEKIKLVPKNESAWNYLRGVLQRSDLGMCDNVVVRQFCDELYKSGNNSPQLLGFMVELCEEIIEKGAGDSIYNIDRALKLCDELAREHDIIRKEYWNYIGRCLSNKILNQVSCDFPPVITDGDATADNSSTLLSPEKETTSLVMEPS